MILTPIDAVARAAVEDMLRNSDRTIVEIATRTGVNPSTISAWNARHRWRRRRARPQLDPGSWRPTRQAAVAALYRNPQVDLGELAVALGGPRRGAGRLFASLGLTGRHGGAGADPADPVRPLRATLRAHIARQIARFDAALDGEAPATLDTAKVLRDLGGLKRLLDETETTEREAGHDFGCDGADRAGSRDLPALRAEIARLYAARLGERPDAGLPGEPAAASPAGACR